MKRRLTELVCSPEKFSESQMARLMTDEFNTEFSRDSVHNKILDLDLRTLTSKPVANIMPYFNKYRSIIEGDNPPAKSVAIKDNQIYVALNRPKLKILHLGDLHIPFQDDEQVQAALNRNLSADLVVTTEVSDCYSLSRFNKNLSIPFEIEVDNVIRYFEYLNDNFPLTFVMAGNHEARVSSNFSRGIQPSLQFLVKDNMLKVLAKPFKNVIVFDLPILQVNDAIFTHAEFFSKTDLKAGTTAAAFLNEWKTSLDIRDYRVVLQSHTHMLGSTYRNGGDLKIMETGCLCKVPDYAIQGFYSKPQVNGYVTLVQRDGITDFDLTREWSFITPMYVHNWNPAEDIGV